MLLSQSTNTQVVSVEELQEQHRLAQKQKVDKLLGENSQESLPSNISSLGRDQRPSQSSTGSGPKEHFLSSDFGSSLIIQPNGSVKGGTVPALVERLTTHEHTDLKFSKTFLMTYTSFATAGEVFDLLIHRFHLLAPEGLSESDITMWREKKQMVVQLRVINVMKSWLEHHFDDTRDDYILSRIRQFADSDIPMTIVGPVRYLKKIVERRESKGGLEPKRIITAQNFPPQPILPKNSKKLKLLDIDPLEMARQLTIIESYTFNRIKPDECLNKNWSGPEHLKTHKAHNIRTMIQLSNRLAAWVTHSILGMKDDVKKRASMIKWFIYVAERCRSLNNFSTMAGIIAGINSPPIRRLKRTWDQVSQKALNIHQSLDTTIDSTKNFANYKQLLRNINPPCVPFLGVYLTYLTFITDGNPDFLKDAERGGQQLTSPPGGGSGSLPLVNFAKRQMAADLISEIQQYQATPYNFTPIPQISKFVTQQLEESDHAPDAFPISLRIEPREKDDEKMARMLSESGFF
ncbi:ras GEF [Wallemia mellicola]|nr:ras GEF [Wallemia mellicola]